MGARQTGDQLLDVVVVDVGANILSGYKPCIVDNGMNLLVVIVDLIVLVTFV